MKLKWQQLQTVVKAPRPLTILSSKDPFLLKFGLDYIKTYAELPRLQSVFIDKQFDWANWLYQDVLSVGLFDEQKCYILYAADKLSKEAQSTLEMLAQQQTPHQFIFVLEQFSDKEKWLSAWVNRFYAITFWPMQAPEFAQWLKQACQVYQVSIPHPILGHIVQQTDRSAELSLQVLEKLNTLPEPHTEASIDNLINQTKRIQIFDLQEAIVQKNPKQARRYLDALWHNQTPLSLFNWLFKTEVLRLTKLKLSSDPQALINKLGIHFSQKQHYLKNFAAWRLKELNDLLSLSEQLDKSMHGYHPQDAYSIILELTTQLILKGAAR